MQRINNLDRENWLKASVEYENEAFQLHGGVYGSEPDGMRLESPRQAAARLKNCKENEDERRKTAKPQYRPSHCRI